MGEEVKVIVKDPSKEVTHSAKQHPVYSDHFITSCGMVVTTGDSRHETNMTGFQVVEEDQEISCESCQG